MNSRIIFIKVAEERKKELTHVRCESIPSDQSLGSTIAEIVASQVDDFDRRPVVRIPFPDSPPGEGEDKPISFAALF